MKEFECLRLRPQFLLSLVRREGSWWISGVVAILLIGIFLSWHFWEQLHGTDQSISTTIRNIALVIAAPIALVLAIWRSGVAERQADTAQVGLLNERFQKAAEMLGSDFLPVRLAGIYALGRVAQDHPKDYHVQVMQLLCAFVRHPQPQSEDTALNKKHGAGDDEISGDPPSRQYRVDIRAAMQAIGTRNHVRIKIENQAKYELDFSGSDLRAQNLRHLNLSGARLENADLSDAWCYSIVTAHPVFASV